MLPSTRELAGVTAQRDTVKMEVDAMNAAMAEQGVHVSEGVMYMVAQVKMIAELRDLLGESRQRISVTCRALPCSLIEGKTTRAWKCSRWPARERRQERRRSPARPRSRLSLLVLMRLAPPPPERR